MEVENCTVCSLKCSTLCSGCRKVYYCSEKHQKQHRREHKVDCFPAKLIVDKKQGRHFVSTSELKVGDLVFRDEAVVYGPSGAEIYLHKICLGCYKVVKSSYVCSKCFWPCCGPNCESVPEHANFECKIFSKSNVLPFFTAPIEYDFIKFLRTLLLRDVSPTKWELIQTLSSHTEEINNNRIAKFKLLTAFEFINNVCKLIEYDIDTVCHVVGVWTINSFGANPPSGPNPTTSLVSFLFPKTSLASHSCMANTRGILRKTLNNLTAPTYRMELRASLKIHTNQPIFITYVDFCEGTPERREVIWENYYFSCECLRCRDPTEFGTYFSAFKCQKCSIGNVLPIHPLEPETNWKCDSESCSSAGIKYIELSGNIKRIKRKLDSISAQNNEMDGRIIKEYQSLLAENQGKLFHSNHWLMIETEYRLIGCLVRSTFKTKAYIHRLEYLCEHILSIINLIQPGHNPYRGRIIFCLIQAKMEKLMLGNKKQRTEDTEGIDRILGLCEEGKEILSLEPEGTEEWKMAYILIPKNIQKLLSLSANSKKNREMKLSD